MIPKWFYCQKERKMCNLGCAGYEAFELKEKIFGKKIGGRF